MPEESEFPGLAADHAGRPASDNPPIVRVSGLLRADTAARLERYVAETGLTKAAVIRMALRAFFDMPPIAEIPPAKNSYEVIEEIP